MWNYRIIKTHIKNDEVYRDDDTYIITHPVTFSIHEVFYDKKGNLEAWTEEPYKLIGETIEDLRKDLELILEAFKKPVLNFDGDLQTPEDFFPSPKKSEILKEVKQDVLKSADELICNDFKINKAIDEFNEGINDKY